MQKKTELGEEDEMKSYTDLEQSKKLNEILPLESADMYYSKDETTYAKTLTKYEITYANVLYGSCDIRYFNICEFIPCWSLAALLKMLKDYQLFSNGLIVYIDNESYRIDSDNPVDACYEMIIKLHKQKLL